MARTTEATRLISSLGVFSSNVEVLTREVARSSESMKLVADRQSRFGTDASQQIRKAMTAGIKDAISELVPTPSLPGGQEAPESQARGGVRPAHRGHREGTGLPVVRNDPGVGQSGDAWHPQWQDAYKQGNHYDITKARSDVGHKVEQALQGREQHVMERIEAEQGFTRNSAGQWIHKASGHFASKAEGEAMEGHLARAQSTYGSLRRLTSSLGEGEGGLEALSAAVPALAKFAGPVAAGAALINQGLNFATDQREANRDWQKISGDSNASGFAQRAKSRMFSLGLKGVMGAGAAEQLYGEVSATGLRGDARDKALDFAVSNFKSMGMDVADSMNLINTAMESGNKNLTGLHEALKGVSASAKAAGLNVDEARKSFESRYATIAQTTGGQAAVTQATAQSMAVSTLGFGLKNLTFTNDNLMQRRQAAALNLSLPEFLKQNRTSGGYRAVEGETTIISRLINRPDVLARVSAYEQQIGKPRADWNLTDQKEFGESLADILPPDAVSSILSQVGGLGGFTPEQAPQLVGAIASGKFGTAELEAAKTAAGNKQPRDDSHLKAGASYKTATKVQSDLNEKIGITKGKAFGTHGKSLGLSRARDDYSTKVTKEGGKAKADPKIEKLLQDGYKGKILVDVGGGKKRAVSLLDAIDNFWDQLREGSAEIGEGDNAGRTIADAFGVEEDKSVEVTSATEKNAGRGEDADKYKAGVAAKDAKAAAAGTKAMGGKLTIEATPELKKLLNLPESVTVTTSPGSTNVSPTKLAGTDASVRP